MRSWKQFVGELPIVGYLLKVGHDFIKLPIVRRDLHNETLFLRRIAATHEAELSLGKRQISEMRSEIALIERHFSSMLDHMSNTASAIHSLEERGKLIQDQIAAMEDRIGVIRNEVRPLQEHVEAIPAALRRAIRTADGVSRRVDDLCHRVGVLPLAEHIERTEAGLLQRFEALAGVVAQQGTKAAITEQNLSAILDHLSNAAAAIHSLDERVKSMEQQVEALPSALGETASP